MDSRLDQNQSELGVLVLSVGVQVLSDSNSLLDQEVQVLWDLWSKTVGLQDSQQSRTSDHRRLWDTVSISQDNTNLGWGETLSGVLHNLLDDGVWARLEPRWWLSRVWFSRRADTFTLLLVKFNQSFREDTKKKAFQRVRQFSKATELPLCRPKPLDIICNLVALDSMASAKPSQPIKCHVHSRKKGQRRPRSFC